MSDVKNPPDANISEAFRKAVEAELRDRAQLRTRRLLCDCCKRTVDEIGEPCRKSVSENYQILRRSYESNGGYRWMINSFADVRLFDEADARPDDMTAQ